METTHVAPDPAANPEPAVIPEPAAQPERARRTGLRAMGWPLVAAGVGIGAAVLLHFRDPHSEGSYGICPVYALTGFYCPGCGGMRGVHNLTDGRILDAMHSNLLVLPLFLAFVLWIGDWSLRAWRGERMRLPRTSRTTLWLFIAALIGYTVLRNTPWGTWLTPV